VIGQFNELVDLLSPFEGSGQARPKTSQLKTCALFFCQLLQTTLKESARRFLAGE